MIKIPAAGFSENRNVWQDNFEVDYVRISQICISYKEAAICSLQFYYVNRQGNYLLSPLRGIDNVKDSIYRVISLDFENEFLTGLSGYYGGYETYCMMNSLTFKTNIKSYGPFFGPISLERYCDHILLDEEEKGSSFDLQLGNVEVFNGFHGSSNQYGITSIGLFVKPRPVRQSEPVVKTVTTGLAIARYEQVVKTETTGLDIIRY